MLILRTSLCDSASFEPLFFKICRQIILVGELKKGKKLVL